MIPSIYPSVIGLSNSVEFNISIPHKGFWSIRVINESGRTQQVLLNNTWQEETIITYKIDTAILSPGMYMVLIKNEGAHIHWVEKLIISD